MSDEHFHSRWHADPGRASQKRFRARVAPMMVIGRTFVASRSNKPHKSTTDGDAGRGRKRWQGVEVDLSGSRTGGDPQWPDCYRDGERTHVGLPLGFLLLFTTFDRFSCCQRLEAAGNCWNEMPR